MIRPFCVDRQYLPKQLPKPEDVQEIIFDEEIERAKLIEVTKPV